MLKSDKRELLELALQNMDQGLVVIDVKCRILASNSRVSELLDIPKSMVKPGADFEAIIRHAARRGDYGTGDPDRLFRKYLRLVKGSKEHRIERLRPDGVMIEIRGRPVKDGGFVITYTDITSRVTAEESLQESEARYAHAFKSVNEVVYQWDIRTNEIVFTPNLRRALGISPGEMRNADDWYNRLHADDIEDYRANMLAHLKGKTRRFSFEFRYRDSKGNWRWARQTGMAIRDAHGRVQRIVGATGDITERKTAQILLEESEQRLAGITKNLPGAVFRRILHADGTISFPFMSEGARLIFGIDPKQVMLDANNLIKIIHPDDKQPWLDAILQSAKNLAPFEFELRLKGKTSEPKWARILSRPFKMPNGDVVWDGVALDITKQKIAEDSLRNSEQKFRDYADSASDWFWETDEKLRFSWFSDRFEEILGLAPENRLGKTRFNLRIPEDDAKKWEQHKADLEARRAFRDFIYSYNDDKGKRRTIRVHGKPVYDPDGRFRGYRGSGCEITSEIQAQAKARHAERQLRDAVESVPLGFALYDASDRLVMFNQKYAEWLFPDRTDSIKPGMSFKNVVELFLKTNLAPASKSEKAKWLRGRLSQHRNPGHPVEHTLRDGRTILTIESRTSDGGIVSTKTDITKLKRQEVEISEKSVILKTALENVAEGVSMFDSNLQLLAVNRKALELLELPLSFMEQGTSLESIFHYNARRGEYGPGNPEKQVAKRINLAKRFETHCFERTRPDGRVIEVSGHPTPDKQFVTTYRDVTEKRHAELTLIARNELLEKLAYGADLKYVLSVLLQHVEAIYPGTLGSVLLLDPSGTHLEHCVAPSLPDDYNEAIDGIEIGEGVGSCGHAAWSAKRVIVEDVQSHPFWTSFRHLTDKAGLRACWSQPILGSDRKVLGTFAMYCREPRSPGNVEIEFLESAAHVAGIAIERKLSEVNLLKAKEDAEISNRAKSQFLANMSHELRTPLNAINGFSEIMHNQMFGPLGAPRYIEYAHDIHESGTHLLSLVNDILDLSKIEVGKLELNEKEVDVAQVVAPCLRIIEVRVKEAGLTLATRLSGDLPRLWCDERAVKQMVLNLLSNAVKFTPAGGKVTIHAEIEEDGCFVLSVSDTGIGIATNDIAKVFTPFSQVDGSLTRKYEGTGLGLSLVKSLVEMHGGTIELESELGNGTIATIRFPADRVLDEPAKTKNDGVKAGAA